MLWETPGLTASLNSRQRQTISTDFGNEDQSSSSAFLWIMWRKHLEETSVAVRATVPPVGAIYSGNRGKTERPEKRESTRWGS